MRFKRKGWLTYGAFLVCVCLALLTRMKGLMWGEGYFFHPDENNMATALSGLTSQNLNPHFFAYNQFPLYLAFFGFKLISFLVGRGNIISLSFSEAVYTLRLVSAVFSTLTVLLGFYYSANHFKGFRVFTFPLLLLFCPGLIQVAHFGTTESILTFLFLLAFVLSDHTLTLLKAGVGNAMVRIVFWGSLVCGMAVATKLTGLFAVLPIICVLVFGLVTKRSSFLTTVCLLAVFAVLSGFFTFIFSFYSFFAWPDFLSAMRYELAVAKGSTSVFYTRQFETIPFLLFPLKNIFVFSLGLPTLLLFFGSLVRLGINTFKKRVRLSTLLAFGFLAIYVGYQSTLYTQWVRFYTPILPLILLMVAELTNALWQKHTWQRSLSFSILVACLIPGLAFLAIFTNQDIRVTASQWVNANLAPGSKVLSEAGNVMDFPLPPHALSVQNFDFYQLDKTANMPYELANAIYEAEYIVVPSRRIFANQFGDNYPVSDRYYKALFSGDLGFNQIAHFSSYPTIDIGRWQWRMFDEYAEETWTVFDHPTIRIYEKTAYKPLEYYKNIIFATPAIVSDEST